MTTVVHAAGSEVEATARAVIAQLAAGKYSDVTGRFDATMKNAVPLDRLQSIWEGVVATSGPFASIKHVDPARRQGYDVLNLTCAFAHGEWNLKLVFDAQQKIAGLFITTAATWAPPPYGQESFQEKAVTVGEWKLPGLLMLPKGAGPFPALVLVHGSGPHDADESIGPNKPFRDLALGLAVKGIATLRFEKRTHAQPMKFAATAQYTVEEEAVADARAAVALLKATAPIDAKRVWVLGHSLGGTLAPRIGANAAPAGLVILAGATRPLEDLVVEQVKDQGGKDLLTQAEASRRAIRDPELKASDVIAFLGSKMPGSYWLDLRSYKPAQAAAALKMPILVLQGERDFQVRRADYDGWQAALAGRADVKLRLYPSLNHLFIPGSGPGNPAEYSQLGHVSAEVIDDIADFISAKRN